MRSDALRRRQRIIDAGCELLPEDGQQMTLEAVAQHAGVGIATLYRNFPTRNSLIYACVLQSADQLFELVEETIAHLQDNPEEAEQILRDLIPRAVPGGVKVLVPTLISPPEEALPGNLRELRHRFIALIERFLNVVRSHGLIHPTVGNLDMLQGLMSLYTRPSFDLGGGLVYEFDVDAAVDIFLKGCEMGIQDAHSPRYV